MKKVFDFVLWIFLVIILCTYIGLIESAIDGNISFDMVFSLNKTDYYYAFIIGNKFIVRTFFYVGVASIFYLLYAVIVNKLYIKKSEEAVLDESELDEDIPYDSLSLNEKNKRIRKVIKLSNDIADGSTTKIINGDVTDSNKYEVESPEEFTQEELDRSESIRYDKKNPSHDTYIDIYGNVKKVEK
jgi:hypothetical protein